MIEKIKSTLTSSYLLFVFDFAEPTSVDKGELSKSLGFEADEIFKCQKNADKAKKVLGKDGFSKALVCYFNQFQSKDGVDFKSLDSDLHRHRKVITRHLGKDKVNYLNLLVSIANASDTKRRGLLEVAS